MNSIDEDKRLNDIIRERGEKILLKFGQTAISQVENPTLIAALEDVKKYWRDFSRPTLTSFSCEAVGGDPELAENAALMFTLASCGFGVHDDILDKSLNKHLRMTLLGIHGIDAALLVGDLLIVKAWTIAHEMIRSTNNARKIADVLETYGRLSVEICEAEFMETQCRRKWNMDLEKSKEILWKEMAETEACTRIGAMLGNGRPNEVEALAEFGRRIGFISRLANEVEDCLNIKGDLTERIENESVPLPIIYAASFSPNHCNRISEIVGKNSISPHDVKELLNCCFETEAFEYIKSLAKKNREEAIHLLMSLRESNARDVLLFLVWIAFSNVESLCI
jgi:geranylgeranyl diphosphate synthase type I